MRLDVVSIFPDYLAPLQLSLVGKAIAPGLVELGVHDLRALDPRPAPDRRRHPVRRRRRDGHAARARGARRWTRSSRRARRRRPALLVLTPSGRRFDQALAAELAAEQHLVLACGRYEGIDARVVEHARDPAAGADEVSIGDYVLNGGEAAALVVIEAVVRLLPGVIGNPASLTEESHAADHDGLLEYPVYTKPPRWRGLDVPEVLFSGHHGQIAAWRREQALERTRRAPPGPAAGRARAAGRDPRRPADAGELLTLQRAAYLAEGRRHGTFDIPPLTETLAELRASLPTASCWSPAAGPAGRLGARRGPRRRRLVRRPADGRPRPAGPGLGSALLERVEALAPDGTRRVVLVTGALSAPTSASTAAAATGCWAGARTRASTCSTSRRRCRSAEPPSRPRS